MLLVLNYVLRLRGGIARDRRDLVLENIALRHQVDVLTRTRRRPALLLGDRLLWLSLSRTWPAWRKHLVIVQPDTVVRWHRAGWRRYWRWRSRPGRRGRPRIDPAIAVEIRRMTEENPRWGHMRVLGELRKLGFRVSLQTIRRYRTDVPRAPSPGWRTEEAVGEAVETLRDAVRIGLGGERHLRRVLREYVSYYNETRPHRSLELEPPAGARELPPSSTRCRVVAEPILGGLHHRYRWAAGH